MNPRGTGYGGVFVPPTTLTPLIDRVKVIFIDGREEVYKCADQEAAERLAATLGNDKSLTVYFLSQDDKSYRYGLHMKRLLVPHSEFALSYDGCPSKILPVVKQFFNFTVTGRKAFWKKDISE